MTAYVPWAPADYLPHLEGLAQAMAAALADADLDAEVPACPGWTVRDLAAHVTHVHRWARGAIVEGHPDTQPSGAPADAASAAAAYRAAADALLETLRTVDPATPCWSFGPKPSSAAFWFRRQPHELSVHLVDVRAAAGRPPDLDADLALDGVDEVARMFLPRQVRLRRMPPLERSLGLVAAGTPYSWVLAGDGTAPPPVEAADAVVIAPADRLLLLLWGRTTTDDAALTLAGDAAAAHAVLATPLTP